MKLSRIEITNFRCFESLTVDLQPDVNVIVGANGAGKTSVLDAIGIALYEVVVASGGGGTRQRAQQKAALQPTDILIGAEASDALVGRKDFVQFRATATNFYPVDGFPAVTPDGAPNALEWTEHIAYRPPGGFRYGGRESENLSGIHRYFETVWQEIRRSASEAAIPLPMVAFYRAHRRIGTMPDLGNVLSLTLSREDAFLGAMDAGADFRTMCQWFYLRENAELRERASRENGRAFEFADLRAVRQALSGALEGVERIFFDGNPPTLKVALRDASGDSRSLELTQLSDGYRTLLALVLDYARRLAQAHPDWPNPLEAPGILVIDELELHLHPRWQQAVIPNLQRTFPNTQLIVATHSPAVLTTVRRENIHLLGVDHTLETIPTDVGTYGAETSRVLAEVFGTHVRPPTVETTEKLREYLMLIEEGRHDGEEAKDIRAELESSLGTSDPDLQRADVRIAQLQVLRQR